MFNLLIFLLPSLNNLIEVFQREAGPEKLFSAPNLLVNVLLLMCKKGRLWGHRKCESNDYMGVWSCPECREKKNIVFRMISDNVSRIVSLNTIYTMADVGADIAQLLLLFSTYVI